MKGKLAGGCAAVFDRLSKLPIFEAKMEQDTINLARVESRDMPKRPFLFVVMRIGRLR